MTAKGLITEQLKEILPEIVSRKTLCKHIDMFTPRTLANLDCQGKGPDTKVSLGRTVGYPKESVLRWVKKRLTITTSNLGEEQ